MCFVETSDVPSVAEVVQILRDGFWDRTEVIRLRDGSLRVRKMSKGAAAPGPWGVQSLRREIGYLRSLGSGVAGFFPRLQAAWDGPEPGYEMSFIPDAWDAGRIAQRGGMTQGQADRFQDRLAHVVFELVHEPAPAAPSLSAHVREIIAGAMDELSRKAEFTHLVQASRVEISGKLLCGLREAMRRIEASGTLARLDSRPCVRLHGDLFLENILLPRDTSDPSWPERLTLIDPVSVAGVVCGNPLFDLVKYESYATGELLALRAERAEVKGFDTASQGRYGLAIRFEDPLIRPFAQVDWHGRFRAAYVRKYGPIDMAAYRLLEGYFAMAMALCTAGLQRRARVLKAIQALNETMEGEQ